MFVIVREAINVREIEKAVQWPGAGAVLSFVGVARDNFEGRAVLGLEYEAYDEMCLPVMGCFVFLRGIRRIQSGLANVCDWGATRAGISNALNTSQLYRLE